jgi:hypothetical protein
MPVGASQATPAHSHPVWRNHAAPDTSVGEQPDVTGHPVHMQGLRQHAVPHRLAGVPTAAHSPLGRW